jgi:ABC-type Fe3+/spermidine/putrescine transport system ATPase subunit
MAGLLRPDNGTIYFDEKPVNDIDPQGRNAVYVPQQYALFPHLTVLENVAFGPLAKGKTEDTALQIASKTLELVRLAWRAQSFPSELSGGMQQRVALARGLASGADLLLLDEPLGALDARLRLDLRHKLRELVKHSRLTAIHVTHDRDEAMSVADHIMVLKEGRIQDYGTPRRVYARPRGIFVANLIGGANFLECVVEAKIWDGSIIRARGGIEIKAPKTQLMADKPVILAIRKERVRISRQPLDMENVLDAEIREIRFLGESREYLVRLTNGDIVASLQFTEGTEPAFRVGEKILAGFEPNDATIFAYPRQGLIKELEMT